MKLNWNCIYNYFIDSLFGGHLFSFHICDFSSFHYNIHTVHVKRLLH